MPDPLILSLKIMCYIIANFALGKGTIHLQVIAEFVGDIKGF